MSHFGGIVYFCDTCKEQTNPADLYIPIPHYSPHYLVYLRDLNGA